LKKLGKYEILAELGHGAMGTVYKARDPLIGRLVALKTINNTLVDRPDLLERFYQEAQSAGKLQHPNIVTIFELGKAEETPYIAMEYLDGKSLEKTITEQTDLSLAMKVGYIVRICQALEYAHKNRVVHRDVKPANIMVNSDGIVKVVDFGIARLMDLSRTNASLMIGTPAYMAPELFRKKKADARSDIWAVGVTFYELVCYQRPFTGEGYDIVSSIMEDDFPPCSQLVANCSPGVDAVIRRMLTKSAADRYQTMEEALLDLEPVWNPLRSDTASALVDRAQVFYGRADLARAQETLRQARQIDSSNAEAKNLLEKVSADLRRTEILPKLEEHLKRGRAFLQSRQFREAQTEAEAALELDSRNESAKELAADAGVAKTQAKVQRELQERIQEIRGKIKRQELTDAIDLALQTVTTLGPDTDLTQLLHAAQVELEQRGRKRAQTKATQETQPFIPTGIQQQHSGGDDSSESALPVPHLSEIASALAPTEVATNVANATQRAHPGIPVLTPPPHPATKTPIPQKSFQIEETLKDVSKPPAPSNLLRKPVFSTKIEPSPETKSVSEQAQGSAVAPGKRQAISWPIVGTAVAVLAVLTAGAVYITRGRSPQVASTTEESDQASWDAAESAMRMSPRDFKEALARYEKVLALHGTHNSQAQPKIDEIKDLQKKEETLIQEAQQALGKPQPDYRQAMRSYDDVIKLDGDRNLEAQEGFTRAEALSKGKDPKALADEGLKRGQAAFLERDYSSALRTLQETLRLALPDWSRRSEAEGYLSETKKRIQQHDDLTAAGGAFRAKNYALAKDLASRAAKVSDGDDTDKNLSSELLKKVQSRIDEKNQYDDATRTEASDPRQAKVKFQAVINSPDGDEDLVAASKNEIIKIDARTPPIRPNADIIAAIDAYTKQGNLVGAEDKLKSLPSSDPDYPRLRSSLDDATFDKNTADAEKVLKEKDDSSRRPSLQKLLDYFKGVAAQNSRYSPVANRYVESIEVAVNPPTPSGGSTSPADTSVASVSSVDKAAIQSVLNRYSDAVNQRKLKDLRTIWPSIPKNKISQYQQIFDSGQKIELKLRAQKWEPHGTGLMVTCQQVSSSGHAAPSEHTVAFYMVKIQGTWLISDMPLSADQ
jgi:serine/threonine protein kinase